MGERPFGTSKDPGDPADFESEPDKTVWISQAAYEGFVTIMRLAEERTAIKDALYAKEKELSEAIYKLKIGGKK